MSIVEGINNTFINNEVQQTDTQISYLPLTSGRWIIQGNVSWGTPCTGPLNSSISSSSISDVSCTVTTFANPRTAYQEAISTRRGDVYETAYMQPTYVPTYQTLSRTVTVTSPQNYYLICNSPSIKQPITGCIFYAIKIA